VNNSAAGENGSGKGCAPARSRSCRNHPKRIGKRLPGEPAAPAKTSYRTAPREGHPISSMDGRAAPPPKPSSPPQPMNPSEQAQTSPGWLSHRAFGALDWASQKHAVVVVDRQGKVVEDFEFAHSAAGWKQFRERLQPYGSIPFAISDHSGRGRRAVVGSRHDRLPTQPQKRPSLPGSEGPRAASKMTNWTPGALPMPAASTARAGNRCGPRTRWSKNCACCAAMKSP
jgi:hypothetical protein